MADKETIQLLLSIKDMCDKALERLQPGSFHSPAARKGKETGKRLTKAELEAVVLKFRKKRLKKTAAL